MHYLLIKKKKKKYVLLMHLQFCIKDIKVSQYFMIFQEPPIGPSEEGSIPLLHPSPGLESPVSSKEADQPSPVSVLEAPFTDDLSSCSECFESLNADLHGNFKYHLFSNS